MNIRRNTVYNVLGASAPMITTLLTVPAYLGQIGEARYGVLALIWLLLGYFGLFDLGLSRATANALALNRRENFDLLKSIFATSLITNALIGALIGLIAYFLIPTVLEQQSAISPELRDEVLSVRLWLALSVPLVTLGGVFSGVLSSHERFDLLNIVGFIGTVLFQCMPLAGACFLGKDLASIVPIAIVARSIPVILSAILAIKIIPPLGGRYDTVLLRSMLSYGGWVMLTNLVGPVLVSVDQFAIANFLGAAMVAQYSVAYSLSVRLQILPQALSQTLFPRLSTNDASEVDRLKVKAFRSVLVLSTVTVVPTLFLVHPFISLWISAEFGASSGQIAQILLVSIWLNTLAFVPFTALQAQGRPDLVAKFHLLEVIPFFIALYFGLSRYGLPGAAFAWTFRVLMDTGLLIRASRLPKAAFDSLPFATVIVCVTWMYVYFGQPRPLTACATATLACIGLIAWALKNDPSLREFATRFNPLKLA